MNFDVFLSNIHIIYEKLREEFKKYVSYCMPKECISIYIHVLMKVCVQI